MITLCLFTGGMPHIFGLEESDFEKTAHDVVRGLVADVTHHVLERCAYKPNAGNLAYFCELVERR
jgi:hypothetical protein